MLVHAGTREEVDSLVQFVAEAADGFGQIDDLPMALVVMNRLLAEHHALTSTQMLTRIMGAPVNHCADLFVKLADCYEGSGDPKLWAEFGEAAGEVSITDYYVRGMEGVVFPIIHRALGINVEDATN